MAYNTSEMMEAMKKLATHMAEESRRTDKHWNEIADNVEKGSRAFDKGFLNVISRFTGLQGIVKSFSGILLGSITSSSKHLDSLLAQWVSAQQKADALRDPSRSRRSSAEVQAVKLADALQKKYEVHAKLQDGIAEIVHGKMGPAYAAVAGSLALAIQYNHTINQDLIQASASVAERTKLMQEISNVQAETGNEMKEMAKAAASLTRYGFDVKGNFRDTLSIIVKMEEGLGVSYETSAELAVVAQRLGTNLHAVADSIARVKADTALSAEQATKFATEISKAIVLLRPGSGSMADQVIDYVNRLSGALQQVGGNAGDIKDLLVGFTQEKGMMGAASLGATPDFLSNPAQAKLVTERFVKYVNAQLAGTAGFQRMATIQMLAQQFGTTADLIANADKMLESFNTTTKHSTDLQEEWRMQTSDLAKTFSKIMESGRAIIQQVLTPILQMLRPALSLLAAGLQWVASNVWAVRTAAIALGIVTVSATIAFARLSKTLLQAAVSSQIYQSTLGGGIFGGGAKGLMKGAASLFAWIPRIGTALLAVNPILLTIAAVTTGLFFANKYNLFGIRDTLTKMFMSSEERKMAFRNQTLAARGGTSYSAVMSGISSMISHGASAAEIQTYLLKNAHNIPAIYNAKSAEERQKMLNGLMGSVGDMITTQRAALKYAGLTEQSEEDKNRQKVLIELFKAVAMNTELQNKLMEHATKKSEIISEKDRQFDDQVERDRHLEKAVERENSRYSLDMRGVHL